MHSILITDSTFVSASLTLRHCSSSSSSCLLRFSLPPLLSFFLSFLLSFFFPSSSPFLLLLLLLLLRYFLLGLLLSSCLTSPDVILVYDGIDSTAPIIGQYCNTKAFVELVSTRKNLFVEFYSRSHFPGQVSAFASSLLASPCFSFCFSFLLLSPFSLFISSLLFSCSALATILFLSSVLLYSILLLLPTEHDANALHCR